MDESMHGWNLGLIAIKRLSQSFTGLNRFLGHSTQQHDFTLHVCFAFILCISPSNALCLPLGLCAGKSQQVAFGLQSPIIFMRKYRLYTLFCICSFKAFVWLCTCVLYTEMFFNGRIKHGHGLNSFRPMIGFVHIWFKNGLKQLICLCLGSYLILKLNDFYQANFLY